VAFGKYSFSFRTSNRPFLCVPRKFSNLKEEKNTADDADTRGFAI
jgi:hypothetical protein